LTGETKKLAVDIPIGGKVISVNVKVGDKVKEGDLLCLIEAMKMENPIHSPIEGTVVQIGVTVEQVVKAGSLIAIIEY